MIRQFRREVRQVAPGVFKYFAVCDAEGIEMCPTFDSVFTASEIIEKANRGERYFDNIPVIRAGAPYPRPEKVS